MSLDKQEIRNKYKNIDQFFRKEGGKHRCLCGCDSIIILKKSHFWNGIPNYIFGHAARLRAGGPSYDQDKYYSVRDIAEKGNVSEQTVRLWTRKNVLVPDTTIGRKNLYLKPPVDDFLSDRPAREPFNATEYISVPELKKLGVSRSKLRALVRAGKIQEPRLYARKTNYLRREIDTFFDQIREDKRASRRRGYVTVAAHRKLQKRVDHMENRIRELEVRIYD